MFPKALGIVLVVGGVSYLVDTLAAFVAPELTATIHPLAALLGGVAEISTLGYLLVKGVRTPPVGSSRPRLPRPGAGVCVGGRPRIRSTVAAAERPPRGHLGFQHPKRSSSADQRSRSP